MASILIAESVDEQTLHHLASSCPSLHFSYQPSLTLEQIAAQVGQFDALWVRPKQVTAKAIEQGAAGKLKLIIRGGAGVNSIDCAAAKQHQVMVQNTPGLNSTATAEYSFALLLTLLARRQIDRSSSDVRSYTTKSPDSYMGHELAGKTIGLIGLGNIGTRMAKRCTAFEMKVIAYNRSPKSSDGSFTSVSSLDALLDTGPDVISLHIPLTADTHHLIGASFFKQAKKPFILLNTARPQLVDPVAFAEALNHGMLISAGIDGDDDVIAPFVKADPKRRCIITHHIADSTHEAQQAITTQMFNQTKAWFLEGKVINRVV